MVTNHVDFHVRIYDCTTTCSETYRLEMIYLVRYYAVFHVVHAVVSLERVLLHAILKVDLNKAIRDFDNYAGVIVAHFTSQKQALIVVFRGFFRLVCGTVFVFSTRTQHEQDLNAALGNVKDFFCRLCIGAVSRHRISLMAPILISTFS